MWESYEHSLRRFLSHTLNSPQYFRLTIDLKKLKFLSPISELVVEDRKYVESISLSYLTSPVFQSNDVFHAVNARPNPRDPGELLITDGFCSFRFEDKLQWRDFTKLFVSPEAPDGGAVLPIYVRARQSAEKCSTLGVATLAFNNFLSLGMNLVLEEMPQVFHKRCLAAVGEASSSQPRVVDLPIFEILLKLPLIAKDTAAMAGLLTVGVAIDVMSISIASRMFVDDEHWRADSAMLSPVLSAPATRPRMKDVEEFSVVQRCCTDLPTGQKKHSARAAPISDPLASSESNSSLELVPGPPEAEIELRRRMPPVQGDNSNSSASVTLSGGGKDHLIQCEMMLLKLNAEQAHQRFRDEVKLIEAKSEERIEAVRKENQKLRSENKQLEKRLVEFEQWLQRLQSQIVVKPCNHKCGSDGGASEAALKKENERLQSLLKLAERKAAAAPEKMATPAAVYPVYHSPDTSSFQRPPSARLFRSNPNEDGSSSSNADSSPLSSRSRQLLAIHLKRSH